jgi:hypothetical protein
MAVSDQRDARGVAGAEVAGRAWLDRGVALGVGGRHARRVGHQLRVGGTREHRARLRHGARAIRAAAPKQRTEPKALIAVV